MKNLMGVAMMLCGVSSGLASDLKEEDYKDQNLYPCVWGINYA
ncbi:MAG: hypothetical protein ACK5TR_06450 [Alphaproteobacteria bacterium]|jgi:hypothetical protein